MFYLVNRNACVASGGFSDFGHVGPDEVVLVDLAAMSDERWKAEDLRVQLSNERSRHESTRATLTEVRALLSGAEEHARRLEEREGELLSALKRVLPLAESWADGVGRSHPDHEVVAEARAVLDGRKP